MDNLKKSNGLKNKENNELRNEIEKLKEVKVKRSNIIDDLKKSYEVLSTQPKMIQDVRKRDDKARTFAPPDNMIKQMEDEGKEIYKHLAS